jgi:hypothetical protein
MGKQSRRSNRRKSVRTEGATASTPRRISITAVVLAVATAVFVAIARLRRH